MKFLQNILFLAFVFLCMYLVSVLNHKLHPITVTSDALKPDLLLENVRIYTREHAYERSLFQLRKAINSMRAIEKDADEKSREAIELAILELNAIYTEIERGQLVDKDLQHAFVKAFNALTVAELRITESFVNADMKRDAIIALGYGKVHIKHAIKFSDQETFPDELKIYTELEDLLSNQEVSDQQIIESLDKILVSLDQLQVK